MGNFCDGLLIINYSVSSMIQYHCKLSQKLPVILNMIIDNPLKSIIFSKLKTRLRARRWSFT